MRKACAILLGSVAVAEILGVNRSTVSRLHARGELQSILAGGRVCFRPEDIARYMANRAELADERWAAVPEFDCYEVSDFGRVRRVSRAQGTRVGRLLRPTVRGGSTAFSLRRGGRTCMRSIYSLMAAAFAGNDIQVRQMQSVAQDEAA